MMDHYNSVMFFFIYAMNEQTNIVPPMLGAEVGPDSSHVVK
jgi:hypothetical protein